MNDNKYWFFGSKLNTGLLLVLIVLMIIAIYVMLQNKETYFPGLGQIQIKDHQDDPDYNPNDPSILQISGNKDDLVSLSIGPGSIVNGKITITGSIKGAYFFEANAVMQLLDANKVVLKSGNITATSNWMTSDPVSFTGTIDATGIPSGAGYLRIKNDNPSDLPQNDKYIDVSIFYQ
jgi:hypothetical protein